MTRVWVLTALVATGAASLQVTGLSGQAPADGPKVVELQKLKDNLYLLTGGGGNSAVFVTDLGVVLVDTKLAGWGQPILDKIKSVTNKPVTTIINTHAHGDHTGSNEFFPTSVEIVAQQNTRLNMDKPGGVQGPQGELPAQADVQGKDDARQREGPHRSLLLRRRTHRTATRGSCFRRCGSMHAGDMLGSKQPPPIDLDNGGSGLAYPTRSRRPPRASRTSTRSSPATAR